MSRCPIAHSEPAARPADAPTRPVRSARRFSFALLGIVSVGIGAIGVVVPGLPTTIFLLFASWCFARSCPWLEVRLVRHRIFRPFFPYLDGGAAMPRSARITATLLMWTAITISAMLMATTWFTITVIAAGAIGTLCVWTWARPRVAE